MSGSAAQWEYIFIILLVSDGRCGGYFSIALVAGQGGDSGLTVRDGETRVALYPLFPFSDL